MANETHNGNLNRSKIVATGTEGQKSSGKSNDAEATLRKGSLPKAEVVRTAKPTPGAAVKAAEKQNTSDEVEGRLAVLPNRRIPNPPKTFGCD